MTEKTVRCVVWSAALVAVNVVAVWPGQRREKQLDRLLDAAHQFNVTAERLRLSIDQHFHPDRYKTISQLSAEREESRLK